MVAAPSDDVLWASLTELAELTDAELIGKQKQAGSAGLSEQETVGGDSSSDRTSLAEMSAMCAQLIEEEKWETALTVVTEEHELTRQQYGDIDFRTLEVLSTYAGVLWQLGRGEDARELLEELVTKRSAVRARSLPLIFLP